MVAINKRRFVPFFVFLCMASATVPSAQAGWFDSIARGTRWLGRQAVNCGAYWAFNTTITDHVCPKLSFLAPGTYANLYQNKLSSIQDGLLKNSSFGIASVPVYALSLLYGGAPLMILQGIPMAIASGAISSALGFNEKQAPAPENQPAPQNIAPQETGISPENRGMHRTLSDSNLLSAQTPAGHLALPQSNQPAVSVANAITVGPDDDEDLSKMLWWSGRKVLKFTGMMATGIAANALGHYVCPWLGSQEWQHVINYAAMVLYGAAYSRIKHYMRPGKPVPKLSPECLNALAIMRARRQAAQVTT